MRGTITKRGESSWRLQVYAGTDPATGKARRVYRTVKGTKRAAERELAKLIVEVERGAAELGESITVERLLEEWLEWAARSLSPKTVYEYRLKANRHIVPALGRIRARRLTIADVDRFYSKLTDEGLAPRSVRQVHAILRRALGQGIRWGYVDRNVAAHAEPPKIRPAKLVMPTAADVRAILEHAGTDELRDLFTLAAATGARRGELAGMRWGDVDLEAGTWSVSRALTTAGQRVIEKHTKTDRTRLLKLPPEALEALRRQRARIVERALLFGAHPEPDGYVWSDDETGLRAVHPNTVSKRFAEARDAAGVTGVRFHDLRHYAATRLLKAGVHHAEVARWVGHGSPATTLGLYAHVTPEGDDRIARILGDPLRG